MVVGCCFFLSVVLANEDVFFLFFGSMLSFSSALALQQAEKQRKSRGELKNSKGNLMKYPSKTQT